ncbi:hypothetical protein JRQ81_011110 [Phrynocephalus forsythii]|uniref:Uncharacterized protein n=1 Tax=Phrynocephalus forsythii TaxID=171643 RepID=A0A9Q0X7K0_9SAUR|nr:hypothetical protein JRQ81_011110 [Phrynocephalus forsythii]
MCKLIVLCKRGNLKTEGVEVPPLAQPNPGCESQQGAERLAGWLAQAAGAVEGASEGEPLGAGAAPLRIDARLCHPTGRDLDQRLGT